MVCGDEGIGYFVCVHKSTCLWVCGAHRYVCVLCAGHEMSVCIEYVYAYKGIG